MAPLNIHWILALITLTTCSFSLEAMKLTAFKNIKCFNQKKVNPLQRASFSTNNNTDILPTNLHKTIVPSHYVKQKYDTNDFHVIPVDPSLHETIHQIATSDFCIEKIEKNIIMVRDIYPNLASPLFSFILYAAFAHQKRGDARIDQKYADLVEKTLLYWRRIHSDPLWNQNDMWFSKRASDFPLHEAVHKNATRIVKALSDRGGHCSLIGKDDLQKSPIHYAQTSTVLEILINHYDPRRCNTPWNKTEMVNLQDWQGNTAAHTCPTLILPILLSHEADITIKNKDNETMLSLTTSSPTVWKFPRKRFLKERALLKKDSEDSDLTTENIVYTSSTKEQSFNGLCTGYKRHETWKYQGITPVMQSIFSKDVERFKIFLNHGSVPQIKKQRTTLRTILSFKEKYSENHPLYEDPSPAYPEMKAHFEQYEKQQEW
jgi:hypothetical protein